MRTILILAAVASALVLAGCTADNDESTTRGGDEGIGSSGAEGTGSGGVVNQSNTTEDIPTMETEEGQGER